MIGTLAVILLIAGFIGSSEYFSKLAQAEKRWEYIAFSAILGGLFGIYGNLAGFSYNGAIISVRDMGPMLAGYISGPGGGLLAGLIAGLHRLMMGGITAEACVVATCSIGLICGFISERKNEFIAVPHRAFILSALMETFHLGIVLLMVKPYETALDIVNSIATPFIISNAVGFLLMVVIINHTKKQREVMLERNRLQSELEVGSVIQHSLLPHITEEYPGISTLDIAASMEAAKKVGGDFYDLFFVDSSHLAFLIGDVSGKGIPAALFMANSKITLQNCIRDIPKLSVAMETANNSLCARNDAEMFVTLWAGVLDISTNECTYVCAGHNPPVIISDGTPEYLRTKNDLVMAAIEGSSYQEHSFRLKKGDVLYLYTDGVTEADNAAHEQYGEERLLECLKEIGNSDSEQINERVKESVARFVNGNSQFDDMSMLCFRIK
ncbi:MAG: SpoIIE family protein phosphatase [Erysipelotrichaceae bacterium]|nr:SpoIIE family protein phosphatase [Erysipelotrichaceae bacterium]